MKEGEKKLDAWDTCAAEIVRSKKFRSNQAARPACSSITLVGLLSPRDREWQLKERFSKSKSAEVGQTT